VLVRVVVGVTRRAVTAAAVGLAGHVALYRTLWPNDTVHGYLSWYEPLVAALSLTAVAALVLLVAAAWAARRLGRRPRILKLPAPGRTFVATTVGLAGSGFAYLLVQETVEHSIGERGFVLATFSPGQLLGLLIGLVAASLLLALAIRVGERAIRAAVGTEVAPKCGAEARWSVRQAERRPYRPLAGRFALRAPPGLSTV
jgi:hypothetical protein